jgi:hypothetical protein
MTAFELKQHLIQKISEIDDEIFLNAIKTILDAKSPSKILSLSQEQRMDILESQKEIEQGLYMEQSEMDKEFDRWDKQLVL